jgi:peptidyl-tRNA hydrolase, PTH1 family
MKLIIGLGNPGEKYAFTRHNAGFLFVDSLLTVDLSQTGWATNSKLKSEICKIKQLDLMLAKPQTFMNNSGDAVLSLTTYYKIPTTNLFVVHDDLDIPLGKYKIQKGVGPKVHNGVNSIEESLGTKDFWRVRIGIDNRAPDIRTSGDQYTLEKFEDEEISKLESTFEIITKDLISRF